MLSSHLLTEAQAAAKLSLAKATLARWRWQGIGPAHIKLGSAVRYAESDLDAFIAHGKVSA